MLSLSYNTCTLCLNLKDIANEVREKHELGAPLVMELPKRTKATYSSLEHHKAYDSTHHIVPPPLQNVEASFLVSKFRECFFNPFQFFPGYQVISPYVAGPPPNQNLL